MEENSGWSLITSQLNLERVALAALGMQAEDHFDEALAHARETGVVDERWARMRRAEAHVRLSATRLLDWRLLGDVGAGTLGPDDASGVKFGGPRAPWPSTCCAGK